MKVVMSIGWALFRECKGALRLGLVSVRTRAVPVRARSSSKAWVPLVAAVLAAPVVQADPPKDFAAAKRAMENSIYTSAATRVDVYCGCAYDARKRVDLASCGMAGARDERAYRIEAEHALPVSHARQQFRCYRERTHSTGGERGDNESPRQYCGRTDPAFARMEADLHNLWPSVGSINQARGAEPYGMVEGERREFGACDFEVDGRSAEPRPSVRGDLARSVLYMSARYGVQLGQSRERLYQAWDSEDPPDAWEFERNRRIKAIQGNSNPWIDRHRR